MATDFRTQQMKDNEQARRAFEHLAWEQSQRDAAEQAEREQAKQQAWQQVKLDIAAAEQRAVDRLAKLSDLYRERDDIAAGLVYGKDGARLTRFCEIEMQLVRELNAIDAELKPHWARVDPMQHLERWLSLRRRANLSESHKRLKVSTPKTDAERIALTMLLAVVNNVVGAGWAAMGGKSFRFNLDDNA